MSSGLTMLRLFLGIGALAGAIAGCGHSSAPNPFVASAGAGGAAGADGGGAAGASGALTAPDAGSNVGGPCVDDGQCDDGIDCTFDHCDTTIQRCRFEPDDTRCADDRYCNGVEVCDTKIGCTGGDPVTCSDSNVCTIDACVEATHECEHAPRDADGDGDPVWNCGGGDCNDADSRISSKATEICANGVDDDCDGTKDETDCSSPEHDTCTDPLDIEASGSYVLSSVAATGDYALSCASGGGGWRDVVAALVIPDGPAIDVDVIAKVPAGEVALGSASQCGDASTEIGCVRSYPLAEGAVGARLVLHGLSPGAYPLFVFTNSDVEISLHVEYRDASGPPTNETCASAELITEGQNVQLSLAEAQQDLTTACTAGSGDLVYRLHLDAARDVHVYATSVLGLGTPELSLRSSDCSGADAGGGDEVTCRSGDNPDLYLRALEPGDYYVSVASTGPDDLDLRVQTSAPTTAAADDACATAPAIPLATTTDVAMAGHTDDFHVGCITGAPDAAYRLDLSQSSDVLLVARIAPSDTGAVALSRPDCSTVADVLACTVGSQSPLRVSRRGLAAGEYRAVVESASATAMQLTAFTRPAALPTLVAFADDCAHAIEIDAPGGFFQGSTANAKADYEAGCDLGGLQPGGAHDQMLTFTLDRSQRVILDMRGSSYTTLLDVRRGPTCPGQEVISGCSAGYFSSRSYLDLTLDAGQYFVQIDGYAMDSGSWVLDAYIADP